MWTCPDFFCGFFCLEPPAPGVGLSPERQAAVAPGGSFRPPPVAQYNVAAMAANKTRPTGASVADYIASRANEQQRADCLALMAMLEETTNQPAKMWGPSIVGHGTYQYAYESGRSGEAPLVGFAIRGRELVLYLLADGARQKALLSKLGKHRMGNVCLYFKHLADLNQPVLKQLVANSVAESKRRPGRRSGG